MTVQQLDTRYGTMFVPDTDNGQYGWLVNTGASPEDEYIEEMCKLLDDRPKGTVIDVGANFGCWTLPLSKHAHRVLAIEPQKPVYELLLESLQASKIYNVEPRNCAAGDTTGIVKIPVLDINDDQNFGGVSLAHHDPVWGDKFMTVPIRRIDDLAVCDQVSFIKADVEGYEALVLEGARKTIARCKPILFVESDHPMTNKEELKELIESFDYAVAQAGGNFVGMPL